MKYIKEHSELSTDDNKPRESIIFNKNGQQTKLADKQKIYAMCVDVAHGKKLDYSAFVVVDISQLPYKVVAKYKNNTITPLALPAFIYKVGQQYNDATILIEVNDIGQQVADALNFDYEYENLFVSSGDF